jgi:hypothetical protein
MAMKIVIETIQQYADAGYAVQTYCWTCQKSGKLDLAKLCQRGFGRTPLSAYREPCKCGVVPQKIVTPPAEKGGRPEFLMR